MKTGHLTFLSVICIFLLFDFITEIQSARVQYQYKKYTYRKKRDVSCSDIYIITTFQYLNLGAQWLRGRVLDSRLRVRGFEPHRFHCVTCGP